MKNLVKLMVTVLLAAAHADIPPLSLIVKPPSSSGINRGFSRAPSHTFYDREKNILVFESTSKLADEMTFSYRNIALYTFREEPGDGEYCIYTVLFTKNGEFR